MPVNRDTAPVRRIVVLGAGGRTGRLLVGQALGRGYHVTAIVRDPSRFDHDASALLTVHRGDVREPHTIAAAVRPDSVVVSGLGIAGAGQVGTLTAGARAVVAAGPRAIVWLGAVGTGRSSNTVNVVTRFLLRAVFGREYRDKVTADEIVVASGGTVVHSGQLTDREDGPYVWLPLSSARRRIFPSPIPRLAVARLMLDVAETALPAPGVVVLTRHRRRSSNRPTQRASS